MKVLSLKQPYAELILQGRKVIEIRKWNTKFIGDFLIHASKTPDYEAMERFGFIDLPLGCIVGRAKLVGVKRYENEAEFDKERELHLATFSYGSYGFILQGVKRVGVIPCKGKLGFWDFKGEISVK